jgi:hypothetical protein
MARLDLSAGNPVVAKHAFHGMGGRCFGHVVKERKLVR